MPLSEICNALVMTYMATEYHVAFQNSNNTLSISRFFQRSFFKKHNQFLLVALFVLNFLERVTGAATVLKEVFEQMLHAPKIVLAAMLYVTALYYDCLNYVPNLPLWKFLSKVGMSFLKLLPIYPFLAVLIAFVFGGLIEVFEKLHIPLRYLNAPIYYGVLYGPFSTIYFQVKHGILDEQLYSIPLSLSPSSPSSSVSMKTKKTVDIVVPPPTKSSSSSKNSSDPVGFFATSTREEESKTTIQYSEADYFQPKVSPLPSDFFTKKKNHMW